MDRLPAVCIDRIGHHSHGPIVQQGTGAHAIAQPLAGADDLQRPAPVFALALPGPAIEIEAALMRRAVVTPVALAPAVIGGVVLGATEAPHDVQGPHDWFADEANIGDRELLAPHPVHMHQIGIGCIEAIRPTRRHKKW